MLAVTLVELRMGPFAGEDQDLGIDMLVPVGCCLNAFLVLEDGI